MTRSIDWSVVRNPPLDWQPDAIERMFHQPFWALFDDVGMGKCYDVIVTACNLFLNNEIDFVVILCPANVMGVWDDPVTGEIHEHMDIEYGVCRISKNHPGVCGCPEGERFIKFHVVSYPYLRNKNNRDALVRSLSRKRFLLVADESSHIKSHRSGQTLAAKEVRKKADFVGILNATPMPNSVLDYWSQFDFLDPGRANKNMNIYQFRNMFCKLGGFMGKQILRNEIMNKDLLDSMYKPYVIQRKRTVPKTYATLPVTMPSHLVQHYEEMDEEMITWLGSEAATSMHAGTKALRLAQITSGFLGGFKTDECRRCHHMVDEHIDGLEIPLDDGTMICGNFLGVNLPPREVDDTKTQAVMDWLEDHPEMPAIIVARFTPEIARLSHRMKMKGWDHGLIWGGPSVKASRQDDINAFMLGTINRIIVQPQAGSEGLNLKKAEVIIFISNDYNYKTRYQTEGRARPRPGHPVLYLDVLMTRANGKGTIDHVVKKKVDVKKEMEAWSTEKWRQELVSFK